MRSLYMRRQIMECTPICLEKHFLLYLHSRIVLFVFFIDYYIIFLIKKNLQRSITFALPKPGFEPMLL